MDVEERMELYLKPLFGDMASMTIKMQKDRLDLDEEMNREDYLKMIDSIQHLCKEMAGDALANKIKKGLLEILNENQN